MYHFEQKEKFWDSKAQDLRNKLSSRSFGRSQNPAKLNAKDVNYEEMRLMNSLAKEEIAELKGILAAEKAKSLKMHKRNEEMRGKVEELQDLNQSLTNLVVEKGKSPPGSLMKKQDFEVMKEELEVCREKQEKKEKEFRVEREIMDKRHNALKNEADEKNGIIDELHSHIKKLQNQLDSHALCENKLLEYEKQIQILEQKVIARNGKEFSQRMQILEEENQMLKEQIEIYQEDKAKGISEKEKMQKLSCMILSKDKGRQELENPGKRMIDGQNFQALSDKAGLDYENKSLLARLEKELQIKLENLEKIKNLQETLSKIAPDCGYDADLPRIKSQIIAVKGQIGGNFPDKSEKITSSIDLYEKTVEIDILKTELKALRHEQSKFKEEFTKISEKNKDYEMKVKVMEATCNDQDFLCFLQCEAAALEDMIGGNGSQYLDSEDFI